MTNTPNDPQRNVVQITVASEGANTSPKLFALCNDGTVWMTWCNGKSGWADKWEQLPNIPQPEANDDDQP